MLQSLLELVCENIDKTFLLHFKSELEDIMEILVNPIEIFLRVLVEFRGAMNPKLCEKFTCYIRNLGSSFFSKRLYF